jgi:thiamine-phosphate pyrophosphorylase
MMLKKPDIKGLYAITPDGLDTTELLRRARLVLQGGAKILQYRNKLATRELRNLQAIELLTLTREFHVPFIINDDIGLAAEVNADGVHLGAGDGTIREARASLGHTKLIGVSCYNRLGLALEAAQQGADYVAFGAFFQSGIKPDAVNADISLLRSARSHMHLPVVAIGGITVQNGVSLLEAGADALAVISALFAVEDIAGAAKDFSKLFEQGKSA